MDKNPPKTTLQLPENLDDTSIDSDDSTTSNATPTTAAPPPPKQPPPPPIVDRTSHHSHASSAVKSAGSGRSALSGIQMDASYGVKGAAMAHYPVIPGTVDFTPKKLPMDRLLFWPLAADAKRPPAPAPVDERALRNDESFRAAVALIGGGGSGAQCTGGGRTRERLFRRQGAEVEEEEEEEERRSDSQLPAGYASVVERPGETTVSLLLRPISDGREVVETVSAPAVTGARKNAINTDISKRTYMRIGKGATGRCIENTSDGGASTGNVCPVCKSPMKKCDGRLFCTQCLQTPENRKF